MITTGLPNILTDLDDFMVKSSLAGAVKCHKRSCKESAERSYICKWCGGAVHGKMKNRKKVGKMNILFQIKVQMDQNQPKLMNFYDLNAI